MSGTYQDVSATTWIAAEKPATSERTISDPYQRAMKRPIRSSAAVGYARVEFVKPDEFACLKIFSRETRWQDPIDTPVRVCECARIA
ncbi:hypothetical protein WT27_10925 [Burkholderia territorii]|uniref:Uncharacterized protein n=1 Tax=Burkholderia territorii TaxID=1503055 RepID=A0A106DLV9_9BURK|nr:hypothetical protein [Burkholderia territorii]KVV42324.1 hypothetical protein WT27_10925 [Burkholderia territorii]KVX31545.1 hypothetical protein WT31_10325 [Burkholderia territorii]